ncbi:hypothetical protein GGS20DRAFT_575059 [Poronia punctata]|nr:hypothetical protein GGS20DRAFT_575059 [Poronia punctata]
MTSLFPESPKADDDESRPPPPSIPSANATPSTRTYPNPRQQPQQHQHPSVERRFPPSFCLYYDEQRRYFIGERKDRPLYAVSLGPARSSPSDLVLHNGPSEGSPQLAAVDHEAFSRSAMIVLPQRPGSRFTVANERLESAGSLSLSFNKVMSFSIETAASGTAGSREHFEWRHSSGPEVEALGGRHSVNRSGDGREVVAVWTGGGISMSKKMRFRFLGTGADGSMGERWAIMAVSTALAMWSRDKRFSSADSGDYPGRPRALSSSGYYI